MDPVCALWGAIFPGKIRKLKSVFGLHMRVWIAYEPIPWNAQCNPTSTQQNNTF